MIFAHELSKAKFVYMCDVAQTRYLKTIIHVQYLYKYCYYNAILLSYHIQCLLILHYYIIFHTFSAFWLRSSVVSVLLSLISETVSNAYN